MMTAFQNNPFFFLAASAITLSFLGKADAASMTDLTTRCLPEDPTVCVGMTGMSTPSPALINGEVQYMGGYGWSYTFVQGLEEGTFNDWATVNDHKTGLMVAVSLDQDKTTCEVQVNGEMCNWCSLEGCDINENGMPTSIQYDCTNIQDGKASTSNECEEFRPILYPFASKEVCTGYIWGDPHLLTFDGLKFDAQPKGEAIFLMDQASPFEIQGRLTQALTSHSLPAVTTGVAIHGNDVNQPTIQLSMAPPGEDATAVINTPSGHSCPIDLYVDCMMQDSMSYHGIDVKVESEGSQITVVYPGLLSVTFYVRMYGTCHFSMEVNLLDCEAVKDTVQGLLGSPNGDISDDWMDRDGNAYNLPNKARAFYFQPAFDYTKQNWMVDEGDSIFCHDDDFEVPEEEYDDEIEELIEDPDECVVEICGDDIGCRIDGVTLGCDAAEEFMQQRPPGTNNTNDQSDDDLVCGE